jgi:glutaredoxin-like protein
MAMLSEKDAQQIKEMFEEKLQKKVVIVYSGTNEKGTCQYCDVIEELLNEVSSLSDLVKLEIHKDDKEIEKKYGFERMPAIAIVDGEGKDYGIRYYGIPSGYEFSTLLEDLFMVSSGESGLSQKTIEQLEKIDKPVNLKVFVTPSCPYCPRAVLMAHKFAMANSNIVGEGIEATEFPILSNANSVEAVPHIVVNDSYSFVGALPEVEYLAEVLKGVGLM